MIAHVVVPSRRPLPPDILVAALPDAPVETGRLIRAKPIERK